MCIRDSGSPMEDIPGSASGEMGDMGDSKSFPLKSNPAKALLRETRRRSCTAWKRIAEAKQSAALSDNVKALYCAARQRQGSVWLSFVLKCDGAVWYSKDYHSNGKAGR